MATVSEETDRMLAEAWLCLGGPPDALSLVNVQRWDPALLSSRLPAMRAMVAAVSASTLAASVLDAARTGRDVASVSVDARHVAAAARSERYARDDGSGAPDLFAALSTFWRTADGWLRLHANYDWHHERALAVLGCDGRPEAVAESIRGWRGVELEDTLADAGALGSVVRNRGEWNAHPHGRAIADLPLMERDQPAGPSLASPDDRPGRMAQGYRVLDLTRVIAGPVATRTLAAWGADVLRIDSPRLPEIPAQALDMLPGKRSSLLDFAERDGRSRLEQLFAEADVVVHGYRPGALDRYGLAKRDLVERHPHLTVVELSAWGRTGPWSGRRGFDSLVQCAAGIADAEGSPDHPGAMPAQVLDHATGYLAAAAALSAVARTRRGEPPVHTSLSLAQTANWLFRGGSGRAGHERPVDPDEYRMTLTGGDRPVHVIGPPGRIDGTEPLWGATTRYGADPPEFRSRAV
ncbi:CoA transferase [Phytoactinopolyspora endophytica]|uniref:CoA transferase n=1 Tax=Phytoactinopolyspora endophytica TaxID=1642495 RepID=UPI00101C7245|nr:CoA transferase [Phytoactinopolyspora endophytica]